MKTNYTSTVILRSMLISMAAFIFNACSEFIDVGPPQTELVTETIFESDASATSAIRGIYSLMMTNTSFTRGSMEEYTGIASDELINYSTNIDRLQFYQNSLTELNGDVLNVFWREAYKYISNTNVLLEGVNEPNGLTPSGKQKIEGEALFIRAFCHFYLASLFGDIPYLTASSYEVNSKVERMPFNDVLSNIEIDLLRARELMPTGFADFSGQRIRPNREAALALLARVYLHQKKWSQAEAMATEIINNSTYKLVLDLNNVFLANSTEAIWQLMPVIPLTDTPQGSLFILTTAPNGSSRRVSMTADLNNAFEANDQRKVKWVNKFTNANGNWFYVYKYKKTNTGSLTEYSMIFRLAEQYLIRAEALTYQEKFSAAAADLNTIRSRAGLGNTAANNSNDLLNAIEQERRVELFGEFGHRWFDLKRMGRIDAVLSMLKKEWQPTDALFPIPFSERQLNPYLSQNLGY